MNGALLERRGARAALALASGLLLVLSFPKFGHWSVAWVALAPLLLAIQGTAPARAARLGELCGLVASVGLLYWTSIVVVQFGGLPKSLAAGLMVLECAFVGVPVMLFAWLVARLQRRFGPSGLLLAPAVWVATETLRTYSLLEFPWCLLGYSQFQQPLLIQVSSLTAVYGVSFLLVASSATLAYALVEPRPRRRFQALVAFSGLVALTVGYGAVRLRQTPLESGRLRVGLVQANIQQEDKWAPEQAGENLRRHLRLTQQATRQGARLVVWPESSVPYDYDREPELQAEFQRVTTEQQAYLLFGNDDRDEAARPPRIFVGAKMVAPDGRLDFRYHKMHLVPFGEYVPFQSLITLGGRFGARLVVGVGEFTRGSEYTVGQADARRFAVLICYEAIFPEMSGEFARRGADLLVTVTNDGWYGTSSAPYQHMMMAVFRAVEQGKYLVRAANTGISAVVDARGRIVEQTGLFEERVLVRDVPIVPGLTPYGRWGDLFAFGCCLLTLALSLVALRGAAPSGRPG